MQTPAGLLHLQWAVRVCPQQWGPNVSLQRTTLCQPGLFADLHGTLLINNSTESEPVLPLQALPGYKKWPVQASAPPLLEVLTWITLIDSRSFYCTRFPFHPTNAPQFQPSLLALFPFILSHQHLLISSILIPIFHWSILKIYWPYKEIHVFPIEPSFLPNFSESVDCRLIIIYLIANIQV